MPVGRRGRRRQNAKGNSRSQHCREPAIFDLAVFLPIGAVASVDIRPGKLRWLPVWLRQADGGPGTVARCCRVHSRVPRRKSLGDPRNPCHPEEVTLTFYVFSVAAPGMEQALTAYEDVVLTLVNEHDGKIVHRARTDGAEGRPLEIQLFEWASQEAMDRYMSDPRRTALAADRDQAIARTEIVPVQIVSDRGVSNTRALRSS